MTTDNPGPCPICGGSGVTPSIEPGEEEAPCMACNGTGFGFIDDEESE
jgi:DnaJ-class molecular chaperone